MHILPLGLSERSLIRQMAIGCWPLAYAEVLSEEQIAFMLDDIYSLDGLSAAMQQGQQFYGFWDPQKEVFVGFMALRAADAERLRIEKLYIMADRQGAGLGQQGIAFATQHALQQGLSCLELNVNRGNKAISFYRKQGFTITSSVDIPYYHYILDDYIMQKVVSPSEESLL